MAPVFVLTASLLMVLICLHPEPLSTLSGQSQGVQRQYGGALGKKANCQAAVSLHYVGAKGHVPLGLRLFLPDVWLETPARLDKAGVPEGERRVLSKGEIALELLGRRARGERAARPGGRGR